jgi:exopolysaccharide biosynthesis polyprenyl glycosylphosphotransferase
MERQPRFFGRRLAMAAVDVLLLHCAFNASLYMRLGLEQRVNHATLGHRFLIMPLLSISAIAIIYHTGLYANWLRRSRFYVVQSACTASALIALAAVVLSFWEREFAIPRTSFLISFLVFIVFLAGSRLLGQHLHRSYLRFRRVLIITNHAEAPSVLAAKFRNLASWFRVEKYLDADQIALLPSLLPDVDIVAVSAALGNKNQIITECAQNGKEVLLIPGVSELLLFSSRTEQVDDLLMLFVMPPILSSLQKNIKRSIDLLASSLLALLMSPLFAFVYFLVRYDSAGPAIYKQERVGQGGRIFKVLKFRTMTTDAERRSGPVLATEHDPRVTRVGRFLRAYRIDELPQLLNVMSGDMSFVGPRPERLFFVEQFAQQIPGYLLRLNVKPGITGLAQIRGKYCSLPEDKLRLDLMYIATYSPILDLTIIGQTLETVLLPARAERIHGNSAVGVSVNKDVTPSLEFTDN